MKKVLILLSSIVFCLNTLAQFGYYYGEKFVELKAHENASYLVIANNSKTRDNFESKISKSSTKEKIPAIQKLSENRYLINGIEKLSEIDYKSEMFRDKSETPVFILPRIILSLKKESSITNILGDFKNVLAIDSDQKLKGLHLLSCNLNNATEVLEITCKLKKKGRC